MKKEMNKVPEHLKNIKAKKALASFNFILLSIFLLYVCTDNKKSETEHKSTAIDSQLTHNNYKIWSYYSDVDEMTSKKRYYAECNSVNIANFKFPYDGGSTFKLTLRNESKKNFVLLSVSKGQFVSSYNSVLRIKFDDKSSENYTYEEPNDGSSNVVFINNSNKFIKRLKKANILRIEAEFYQEGPFVIKFDVDSLKWDK